MPKIVAKVDFLADLALYDMEKPYFYLPGKDQDIDPEDPRLNNLEFSSHTVEVEDIREHPELTLFSCGFTFINHTSSNLEFQSPSDVDAYKRETEDLLTSHFSAVKVLTYEVRLRKNQRFERRQFDLNDKLLQEGPAKGAHNDVTYTSGPNIIQRYLPVEDQKAFLRTGYRIRIFNTWRPLLEELEDRPLGLCDSSSVVPDDLIAADRILPDRVGEVYYLRHNASQKWYWLERQKCSEPFLFLMYDTLAQGSMARFCPHVSFDNSRASSDAERRRSVETRSIVISKVESRMH